MVSASKTPSSDIHSETIILLIFRLLSCLSVEIDHDLTDGLSGREMSIRGTNVVERKARVDDGAQPVLLQECHQLLEAGSAPSGYGAQGDGATKDLKEIERHRGAADIAEEDHRAAHPGRRYGLREHRSAHHVDEQIDPPAVRRRTN